MSRDQSYNTEPAKREKLQKRIAKVFDNPQNREAIFRPSKMSPQGRHSAWVLGQHMDTRPETQKQVLDTMKTYNPSDKRTEFLKDRISTNDAVRKNYSAEPNKYARYGSNEDEAVKNVRPSRKEFETKNAPKTPQGALELEKKKGNDLLVKSVQDAGAKTQPSFATRWDDLPSPKPKSTVDTIKSTASEYASKALSNPVVKTGLRVLSNPVVGGIMTAMEPTPANAGEDELLRQKKYQSKTP